MRAGALLVGIAALLHAADTGFLAWDAKRAAAIGSAMRANGDVGRGFDFRVIRTDRSINYKLRATWMTPDAIRACARLEQLGKSLTDAETLQLLADAERVGDTVVLVELDPREGSGVIPRDWTATLVARPRSGAGAGVSRGVVVPALRDLPALRGFGRRDYAYDVFWVVFALRGEDGKPLFDTANREAELLVRIYDKVGKVHWSIPDCIRSKLSGVHPN